MKFQLIIIWIIPIIQLISAKFREFSNKAFGLIRNLTLDEKLDFLLGKPSEYSGFIKGVERLGIPDIKMLDGPQGVAHFLHNVTCFPSVLSVVSSWDRDLIEKYASEIAKEIKGKGANLLLGPMINIARIPNSGRNFESMGEDPYLTSEMVRNYINGVQKEGVMSVVKHFAFNNQEDQRQTINVNVDERTSNEIYLRAFHTAIQANVSAVMCSYNKVFGEYSCENEYLLKNKLRDEFGFKGWVMSDWNATHSTLKSFRNGLDQEMGTLGKEYFSKEILKELLDKGEISIDEIDEKIQRILRQMIVIGLIGNTTQVENQNKEGNVESNVRDEKRVEFVRKVAEESIVLLKNEDSILPINSKLKLGITIIGNAAENDSFLRNYGSAFVESNFTVSPINGIKNFVEDSNVTINYFNNSQIDQALITSSISNYTIIVIGLNSEENSDRKNLYFNEEDENLIQKIPNNIKNLILVVENPAAFQSNSLSKFKAIISTFYAGEQIGNALASILFGAVNPSGSLPITFPSSHKNSWIQSEFQYPGYKGQTVYLEKLLVGYRWYNEKNLTPLFPFGHGLSYSKFELSGLKINEENKNIVELNFEIINHGPYDGRRTVQVYLSFPKFVHYSKRVLKEFEKVFLKVNERKIISFKFDEEKFRIWENNSKKWVLIHGEFEFNVGFSSQEIILKGNYNNENSGAQNKKDF